MQPGPIILVDLAQMGAIWGLSVSQASRLARDCRVQGVKEGSIILQKAVKKRPIAVDQDEFERLLAGALCMRGQTAVDPVEAAREQWIWDEFYREDISAAMKGKANAARLGTDKGRLKAAVAAQIADLEPLDPDKAAELSLEAEKATSEGNAHTEQLTKLRMLKLESDIERNRMRQRREMGELIERSEVEGALQAAGGVIKATLMLLPGELAALVAPELKPEVYRKAEDAIDRCLHAVHAALARSDDDDDELS